MFFRTLCAASLAVLSLTVFTADIRGQTPPPGVSCPAGWLQMSITTNIDLGFPCPPFIAEVWFCIPDPAGPITPKEMLVIKAVRKLGGGPFPCPLMGMAIRQLGEFIMFNLNPGGWQVPVSCNPWCQEHPECPCPSLYPQWVAANGSCGKMVPEEDSMSVVMCGEVDGEGQNCYYSYQVCKNEHGAINRRWVGKQVSAMCPGFGMSSECVVPLCDNIGVPELPTGDTCKEDTTGTPFLPRTDFSGVGTVQGGGSRAVEEVPGRYFDKGARKWDE